MQLNQLKVGHKATILSFNAGHPHYRQKLIAMGLLPGTEFTVLRMAPLGDPIEIGVRGISLSLRKNEANILLIKKL